jgi:hypothetical protein
MRTITTAELKKAALTYYHLNKLTAQTTRVCTLREADGSRCAIGTVLTSEEIERERHSSVALDLHDVLVHFEDPDFAQTLLEAHDYWCSVQEVSSNDVIQEAKAEFLELLS